MLLPNALMSLTSQVRSRKKMTRFHRSIARFCRISRLARPALAPGPCRVAAMAAPPSADAATRRRAGGAMTAPGTWSSPPRGAIAVRATASPSLVTGSRVSSAGGGRVSGSVNRAGAVAVSVSVGASRASGGGRLAGSQRRGLAGAASSPATAAAAPGRRRGADSKRSAHAKENGPPDHPTGRLHISSRNSNQRGASTITTWRPSKRASCSTLANSATSALTLSSSLVPISWCAISRPR